MSCNGRQIDSRSAHRAFGWQMSSGGLFLADFTALSSGAASTLFGLSHTRGSSATVQVGTSSIVVGLGTDVAGIGRALDADALALVLDEARTNSNPYSSSVGSWTYAWGGTSGANGSTDVPDVGAGVATGKISYDGSGTSGNYRAAALSGEVGSGRVFTGSAWSRLASGARGVKWNLNGFGLASHALGTTWTRQSVSAAVIGGSEVFLDLRDGAGVNSAVAYYVAAAQIELGAYATEAIPTAGATATRAGARLWHPSSAMVVRGGRLEIEYVLQAKGATTDYASAPYLWRLGASDYATISNVDGKVTTTVGGASYTTAGGITWAQGDVMVVRMMVGGGSLQTVVNAGKGATEAAARASMAMLGTSGAPQAALPVGALDLLQDGSAGNVFSCRLRKLSAYAPGVLAGLP